MTRYIVSLQKNKKRTGLKTGHYNGKKAARLWEWAAMR